MTDRPPLAKDLELVFVYVSDIDRSVSFYRDVLGIPLEQDARDSDWYAARFPSGVRFALHSAHEGAMPQPPGSVIVDFVIDDVDEAMRRLERVGVAIRSVMRERWGSTIEVADPDGHRVQLYEAPKRPAR